ncbi:MAG: RhuM family protein [Candidatus Endonucleobacter bathymodioli]|uniref:RhuM family protein n=1 Tax=Candidatus Endonucleibacter bathymodioli TaxID=539814 RepID=A0AA90NVT9_9GAMM|nr:RhuM family protein [Candidatus Endonucleobacter bathymodioli]
MKKALEKQSVQTFSNFVIFKIDDSKVNIDVKFQDETLWLTQKQIGELFAKSRTTVTEHLKNIFASEELDENAVCRNFRRTATDGKNYNTKYYNLQAIIAVGYKSNSHRATAFRKWATQVLHEYIIKGFAMDDERAKQAKDFGKTILNYC